MGICASGIGARLHVGYGRARERGCSMRHTGCVVGIVLAFGGGSVSAEQPPDPPSVSDLDDRSVRVLEEVTKHITIDPEGTWLWTEIGDRVLNDRRFADHEAFDSVEPQDRRLTTEEGASALSAYGNYNQPAPHWLRLEDGAFMSGKHAVLELINDRREAVRRNARQACLGAPDVVSGVVDQVIAEGLIITVDGAKDGHGRRVQILLEGHPLEQSYVDGDEVAPCKSAVKGRYRGSTVLGASRTLEWREYRPGLADELAAVESATPDATWRQFRDATESEVLAAIETGDMDSIPEVRPSRYIAEEAVPEKSRTERRSLGNGWALRRRVTTQQGRASVRAWKWDVEWRPIPSLSLKDSPDS